MARISTNCEYRSFFSRMGATVVTLSVIVIFSMFGPTLILGEEKEEPLEGGEEEPLGTLNFKSLGRIDDPVVVVANQIPDLIGTPVNDTDVFLSNNDILVYVWNGLTSSWKQIPFQVDERNLTTGSFGVNNSNGVLDEIDEIVFMAKDTGDQASQNEWVVGCDAPRYEVDVEDPVTADRGWAYIYKSSKIEAGFTEDYVRFDTVSDEVFTESYTMGFRDEVGMVVDYINVTEAKGGDGKNLVDTLEFEAIASLGSLAMPYDENTLGSKFAREKDGYVRALGVVNWHFYRNIMGIIVDAYFNFTWKFYEEYVNATGYLDIYVFGPVVVNISLALDHNSTAIPLDYRDLGGNTAVINGIEDDNITDTQVQRWWEVSSPHGGYVCVWNVDLVRESSELKFDENASGIDHANAEPGLYGRTGGLFINITHDQVSFANLSFFPIASGVTGVAEDYAFNLTNALLITTLVHNSPTIWVDKEVDVAVARDGDLVNYTIFFNNTGDRDSDFVWINDTLPSDVTFFGHDANSSPYFDSFNPVGNILYFRFLDVPPGVHYFTITVTVNSGAPFGVHTNHVFCNFTNHISEMMPESSAFASFQVISSNYLVLKQGWNLISLPFIQLDTNLDNVLSSISGLYDAVQWYDVEDPLDKWKHNKVGKPFGNDLFQLNETLGFWIHILPPGDTIFPYNGIAPSVNQNISIRPGWNLVGYPSGTSYNRTLGLNTLNFGSEIDCIQWYDASTKTWHFMGSSDNFVKGRGYWMHSKVTEIWDVPL